MGNHDAGSFKSKSSFSHRDFFMYIAVFVLVGAITLFVSFAAPHRKTSCAQKTPLVRIENTYKWATWGSWGKPGQKLTYMLSASNYDQNCGSSTFNIGITAPAGYTVSMPSNSISLASESSSLLYAYVTSPANAVASTNPITATITRASNGQTGTGFTSYYMVYTSDTTAPTLYVPNPSNGQIINAKQYKNKYQLAITAEDDHAVKTLQIYIDGNLMTTVNCTDISYSCMAFYTWSLHGQSGPHVAMFKATDWFGNVGTTTSDFTVQ